MFPVSFKCTIRSKWRSSKDRNSWWGVELSPDPLLGRVKYCGCHEMLKLVSLTARHTLRDLWSAAPPCLLARCIRATEMGFPTLWHGPRYIIYSLKWALSVTDERFWRVFKRDGRFKLRVRSFWPLWLDGHFCFEIRIFSVMNVSLTSRWVGISRMASVPNTGCMPFKLDSDIPCIISLQLQYNIIFITQRADCWTLHHTTDDLLLPAIVNLWSILHIDKPLEGLMGWNRCLVSLTIRGWSLMTHQLGVEQASFSWSRRPPLLPKDGIDMATNLEPRSWSSWVIWVVLSHLELWGQVL